MSSLDPRQELVMKTWPQSHLQVDLCLKERQTGAVVSF